MMLPRCQIPHCENEAVGCERSLCAEHAAMVPQRMYMDVARARAQLKSATKPESIRIILERLKAARQRAVQHVMAQVAKQEKANA